MILRPYQVEAKGSVFCTLATARSTLMELATGLGKTVVFAYVADEWLGRVLVLAHRYELVTQAAEKICTITGRSVAIEMGRQRAFDELYGSKIVVASVQTMARESRRRRFHPDHFSLIIIDEGHHATAVTYREVLDYFASAKLLFVSATPKRADGVALGGICESVAYQYGIEPAISDGWLVPVKQTVVKVDGLDFSKARTVARDFNQADLEAILTAEEPLHKMVASGFEIVGNRQTLWFCTSVLQARMMANVLARYAGANNVRFLSGETPSDERRDIVRHYKDGKVQHLLNCALFIEGFDAPTTSAVVMARPTKSVSLYTQTLGRGTRPLHDTVDGVETAEGRRQAIAMSAKPDMLVIDYAGNAGRHKIVQAADVLAGKHGLPVREYAKQTMADEECRAADLEDALQRSEDELLLEAEENEIRRAITGRAMYSTYDVNPFTRQYRSRIQTTTRPSCEQATGRQVGYILHLADRVGERWVREAAESLSKRQATGVISKLRRKAGLE